MNILKNPSFELGWTHEPYNVPELQIPTFYNFSWWGPDVYNEWDVNHNVFGRPEMNVKGRRDIPDNEEDYFFVDGDWTLKVFGAWRPVCWTLTQFVNLEPGHYALSIDLFSDLVSDYKDGVKVAAQDPMSGMMCLVSNGEEIGEYKTFGGDNVLKRKTYSFAFDQYQTSEREIGLRFRMPHGLRNNGIFTDGWSLVRLGNATDPRVCYGSPRIDYPRTYILLPSDVSRVIQSAIMDASRDAEATIGFSADDAGIGDLSDKRVIAINPQKIGTGLDASWYDEHYPGTEFLSIVSADPFVIVDELEDILYGPLPDPDPDPDPDPPPSVPKFSIPTLHLQTEITGWTKFVESLYGYGYGPRAIKFVGGYESANVAKAIDPDIITVGRHHVANQDKFLKATDKKAACRAYLEEFAPSVTTNKIDVVSDLNETIATDNLETIRNATEFSVEFAKAVNERWGGEKGAVLLDTAVGNPREGEQTRMLIPVADIAVQLTKKSKIPTYVGYHSYWWRCPSLSVLEDAGILLRAPWVADVSRRPRVVHPSILEAIADQNWENVRTFANNAITRSAYPLLATDVNYVSGLESWWEWHAGRVFEHWLPEFAKAGLHPRVLCTEMGAVGTIDLGYTLLANAGWKDPICLGGNLDRYVQDIILWMDLVRTYGDVCDGGTIFTIGQDYVGWGSFKMNETQLGVLSLAIKKHFDG